MIPPVEISGAPIPDDTKLPLEVVKSGFRLNHWRASLDQKVTDLQCF